MRRQARHDPRVDLALAALGVVASAALLVLPAAPRGRVAGALRASVIAPLALLQEKAETSRRAVLDFGTATRVADSVRLRAVRLDAVEAENARLRALLGLGSALKWGFVPAEALQGRAFGDDHTVALGAGARDGVRRFSPVIAPEGLVGMVDRVEATTSVAVAWPHPDFRVSAISADGNAFGIVYPHLGNAATRFLLELRGVPFRNALKPGTLIVSAGLGGVFPRGIPIGTVMGEVRTTEGWARTYLLRPIVRAADVTTVMVLTPERAKVGVASVWATAVDSAARGVVHAGDSLARRDTLLPRDSTTRRDSSVRVDTSARRRL
ncbi:MAG: rod shape-determining protein MreC [Gemmatimonadaceae bacterium]|nr:rod shape-determining protein MreC [Gemmatimonadaceae bacterium]